MKALLLLALVFTGCVTTAKFQKEQAVCVNQASGFMINQYVVTANHVADGTFVVVRHYDGKEECGVVVARDLNNDIALIQLEHPRFYDYDVGTPNVKDAVNTIANPMGLSFSEMSGEVQNVDRDDEGQLLIQIGIDVFFGSSGAPVFNDSGQLLGMIVKAVPGTRFTFIVPIHKIVLLIKKQPR